MSDAIAKAFKYSEAKLGNIRSAIAKFVPKECTVVACGSYGRHEASEQSDIDFYTIAPDAASAKSLTWHSDVQKAISSMIPVQPAPDGAFSMCDDAESMLVNIGGEEDSNAKMTRRIL